MKDLSTKDYLIGIIPFLTFVASLYQIVFWRFFGLNGLEFISVGDIITSCVSYLLMVPLTFLLFVILMPPRKQKPKENDETPEATTDSRSSKFNRLLNQEYKGLPGFIYFFIGILLVYSTFTIIRGIYGLTGFLIGNMVFVLFVIKSNIRARIRGNRVMVYALMISVLLPCFAIGVAIEKATRIKSNKEYHYIRTAEYSPSKKMEKLKIIGFGTNQIVLAPLDNSRLIIIQRDIDSLNVYSYATDPNLHLLRLFTY